MHIHANLHTLKYTHTLERQYKTEQQESAVRTETSLIYLLSKPGGCVSVCVGAVQCMRYVAWVSLDEHVAETQLWETEDAAGSMSPDGEEYDMFCQKAVTLIVDLCLQNKQLLDQDTCQDFLFLLSNQNSDHKEPGKNI